MPGEARQPAGPDSNDSQSWHREYCRGSQRNGPVSSWCLGSDWKTFSSCLKSPCICQDTKINDPAAVGRNWVVDGKAVRGTLTLGAFWSDKLGYLLVHHDFSVLTAIIRQRVVLIIIFSWWLRGTKGKRWQSWGSVGRAAAGSAGPWTQTMFPFYCKTVPPMEEPRSELNSLSGSSLFSVSGLHFGS